MRSEMSVRSLAVPGFLSDVQAFWAVVRREWTIFVRYPSWIIALLHLAGHLSRWDIS